MVSGLKQIIPVLTRFKSETPRELRVDSGKKLCPIHRGVMRDEKPINLYIHLIRYKHGKFDVADWPATSSGFP
jgi:hypothetical protein